MDRVGSISDYIEIFEELEAADVSGRVSVSRCKSLELVTMRLISDQEYRPEDEIVQHVSMGADGKIGFHTNTYHQGPGHYGIGRVLQTEIPTASVQEMFRLLDTWLFTRQQDWAPAEGAGKWYLRVRQQDGREEIQRGLTDGAFMDGIDICQFMRERIPISDLYLFDQELL